MGDSPSSTPTLSPPEYRGEWEFTRYIHVGLLCVQESARDRPTVSDVAFLLSNQNIPDIPTPTRPAFTFGPAATALTMMTTAQPTCSVNLLTMSVMEAR
ncbi:hypothetical protein ACLOJK_040793 [Asimina triloba]